MAWQAFTPCHPPPETPPFDSLSFPQNLCQRESYSVGSHCLAFEHMSILCKHRESVSSSSGSSIYEPASPVGRRLSAITTDHTAVDSDMDSGPVSSEEPWNLVAYHIPWGPCYEGYKTGTLPGPDGVCVFLRSPTPLKRQRTSQACEKCRERKAKCSGDRPSCVRCLSRGIPCVYGPSTDAQSAPPRPSHRRQSHSGSSGLKPQHLRLSTRFRRGRRGSVGDSVADSHTSSVDGSFQSQSLDFQEAASFCNDIATNLGDDSPNFSHVALHSDWESPVEPATPSPFISSPGTDRFSVETGEALRVRDPSSSDNTSASLYTHPLSSLEEYRFPPENKDKGVTPAIPSVPIHSHHMNNSDNSILTSTSPSFDDLDSLWHGIGFLEVSGTIPHGIFAESFADNMLFGTVNDEYRSDTRFSLPSRGTISQQDFEGCGLD